MWGNWWRDSLIEDELQNLNDDIFMGYASTLYEMIQRIKRNDAVQDPQASYTKLYREQLLLELDYVIQIDHSSKLFHNLNRSLNSLDIIFSGLFMSFVLKSKSLKYLHLLLGKIPYFRNTIHNTIPAVIRANKDAREYLQFSMKNYLPTEWNPVDGCLSCRLNMISLQDEKVFQKIYKPLFYDIPFNLNSF